MCTHILIIIESIHFYPSTSSSSANSSSSSSSSQSFLETSFLDTFDLTLHLIRPFAGQAQPQSCRQVRPGCVKQVWEGVCYWYAMYKYIKLRYTKYIRWIYIIALVYIIEYLNWYIPRICFQRVHMPNISQVNVVYFKERTWACQAYAMPFWFKDGVCLS